MATMGQGKTGKTEDYRIVESEEWNILTKLNVIIVMSLFFKASFNSLPEIRGCIFQKN